MQRVRHILALIRFSHTLFALPFALFGAVLAWHKKGAFAWIELAGILLCMVFARSAAMAFNRLADRRLDAANPRTASRHLPAGQLSVGAVRLFTLTCSVAFVAAAFLFYRADPPNPWPSYLAAPVLVFICAYSYTKRFTALAHFWLGASLLLAPLAAWIAILGLDDLHIPLTLGGAVLFWVAGFDIIYACQDADFDRRAKLHSVPATIGVGPALRVASGCHVVMLGLLAALYFLANPPLGIVYLAGISAVAALLIYEHAMVSPNDLTRVNQAFFHVNAVISIGLFLVALVEVWRAR
ncbi:MAG: putative 4-hydroxybenzoate polyprenyltransferase [Gemmataceae bacterium]|nr:putative 4-hydroxybenzoate polyprenyltransferase [Gemmataceae bacterium]